MKIRGLIALLLSLVCTPVLAQTQPGASPLSGAKGGTNNAFMQFSGPATSLKTYTLPNVTGTLAMLSQVQTWTGAQTFSGGGGMSGTFTGTPTFTGSNFLTLSNLVQSTAGAQFLGVSGASAANYAPFTLSGLPNLASPHATLDLLPIVDHLTGTIKNVSPSSLGSAGAVSSVNAQGGALVLWTQPQGRLTLTSGTPVMATSVAAATTVYYTGYTGKNVPIYNGTAVAQYQICAANTVGACELSIALGSNWTTNTNYDFFVALDSGTVRLCTGPSWNSGAGSDVTRGTGGGSTELQQIDGLDTNKNIVVCRYNNTTTFNVAVNQGTFVGTCRMSAAGQTQFIFGASSAGGTAASFNCWNRYNRVSIKTTVNDSNLNWAYTSSTIRPADNSTGNRASFISGFAEDGFSCHYANRIILAAATSSLFTIGCALDSITVFDRKNLSLNGSATSFHLPVSVKNNYNPVLGWHFVQAMEAGDATNANQSAGGTDMAFMFEFEM